jgi:hypothetical protein
MQVALGSFYATPHASTGFANVHGKWHHRISALIKSPQAVDDPFDVCEFGAVLSIRVIPHQRPAENGDCIRPANVIGIDSRPCLRQPCTRDSWWRTAAQCRTHVFNNLECRTLVLDYAISETSPLVVFAAIRVAAGAQVASGVCQSVSVEWDVAVNRHFFKKSLTTPPDTRPIAPEAELLLEEWNKRLQIR